MKQITSLANPLVKELLKLYDKNERINQKKFLIEGYHLVNEALNTQVLDTVLITQESDYISGVNNILVSTCIINKLAKTKTPQPIMGICKIKENKILDGDRFLLLDNLSDPGNVGTIIRTALGFKIDGIIVSPETVDVYNDKVIRSTQGAIFKVPLIQMPIIDAIEALKAQGVKVIGTALKNSISLKELVKPKKYAIVLGNEAQGITEEVLRKTDVNVKIDINEALESLNVAIAGAIMMFYLS